jgi:hypothetical protein
MNLYLFPETQRLINVFLQARSGDYVVILKSAQFIIFEHQYFAVVWHCIKPLLIEEMFCF